MRSLFVVASLLFMPSVLLAQGKNPHIVDTDPLSPREQLKKFHLPPGFEIQLVAAEPRIKKPINIAFDSRGRLWVTGSEEYPFAAPDDRKPRDTVKILEDFAPDGLARKVTTYADGLNIPIGVLPLNQNPTQDALIFSIPSIYRMSDKNGDEQAESRKVLYTGYGQRDTHGLTGEFMWGLDGWVYCCHGFSNTSNVKSVGKDAITMQSGNTYRIKPNGSRIEYFTHGQVNPFGLAFDPFGNLFSADCHTRPLYHLLKGAYYPSFGKPHDGLGFGPEMVTHSHGSTGIAGVAYYADDRFPPEFRDNVFIGNVITNRVNRDRVEWHGATAKGIELPDFLRCDDRWFRPVDVKLGPDGALYVADFYNRIIGHYEVPLNHPLRDREKGRIWRIVYTGKNKQANTHKVQDLAQATSKELIVSLKHPNLTVRTQATHALVGLGAKIAGDVAIAFETGSPTQRAHGLWVLERLGKLGDAQLAAACKDDEALVRVHAQRVLAERPTLTPVDIALVNAGLKDSFALVRRCAVEALGSHPAPEHVGTLLAFLASADRGDAQLIHVTRMALRDQLRSNAVWASLESNKLTPAQCSALADVCPGVHNEESAAFLVKHLAKHRESPPNLLQYAHYAARFGKAGNAADLFEAGKQYPLVTQSQLLQSVYRGTQEAGRKLGKDELAWAQTCAEKLLAGKDRVQIDAGIDLAESLRLTAVQTPLTKLALEGKAPETQRHAIQALCSIEPGKHVESFGKLLRDPRQPIELREQLAQALGGTNLAEAQKLLVEAMQAAPARLQTSIALGLASSGQGGERLLQAVSEGKASARLLQEANLQQRLRQARVRDINGRLTKLTQGLPPRDKQVLALLNKRRAGFVAAQPQSALGAKLFVKHCAACHQLSNQGAKIGPQLDGVGARGLDRLIEDILDPGRNVDQAFRATTLVLKDGKLVTGLLLRKDGKILVMADNQGKEVRVPEEEVDERTVGQLSPMPANWAEIIPVDDFNHLLGYLLEQRVK